MDCFKIITRRHWKVIQARRDFTQTLFFPHSCSLVCESFASGEMNLPPLAVFFIFPSFCLPLLPAYPCLPRSVRRLCWSVCWKSCGSWSWTPWKRPSFCRRSQIKRWEHKYTHTHTHTFENVQGVKAELLVWRWWRLPMCLLIYQAGIT